MAPIIFTTEPVVGNGRIRLTLGKIPERAVVGSSYKAAGKSVNDFFLK
jgi:hypothetical protein